MTIATKPRWQQIILKVSDGPELCGRPFFSVQLWLWILAVKNTELLSGEKLIINFPTKQHWKMPSTYEYIEEGLIALVSYLKDNRVKNLAMNALGCGNGSLDWHKVKALVEKYLTGLDIAVWVYEP